MVVYPTSRTKKKEIYKMFIKKMYDRTKRWEERNDDSAVLAISAGLAISIVSVILAISAGLIVLAISIILAVLTISVGLIGLAISIVSIILAGLAGLAGLIFMPSEYFMPISIAAFILSEIIYFADKRRPNGLWQTAKFKAEAWLDSGFLLGIVGWLRFAYVNYLSWIGPLSTVGYYALMTFGVVGLVLGYLWINMKLKGAKEPRGLPLGSKNKVKKCAEAKR